MCDASCSIVGEGCLGWWTELLIVGSDGTEELYHLTEDPGETQNRASELSDVMADLHCALSTWRTSTNVTYRGQQVEENAAIIKSLEDLGYF